MTLHLLSFKSPETQYFEKQMDANEKLNTIKHNQIEQKINELKSEQNFVHNDKKIYDHFNERLKTQNYVLPDKIKVNEIQFTSDSGDVLFNSKFIIDIQQNISYLSTQFELLKEQHKLNLDKQRKETKIKNMYSKKILNQNFLVHYT